MNTPVSEQTKKELAISLQRLKKTEEKAEALKQSLALSLKDADTDTDVERGKLRRAALEKHYDEAGFVGKEIADFINKVEKVVNS